MRRSMGLGLAGLSVVGLGLMGSGPIRARQIPFNADDTTDCRPIQPETRLVAAPAHSVAWTRTWLQLQKVEPLNYPDGVKLGDLVRRVRTATTAPDQGFPRGVSVYVDQPGLADADQTIDAPVTLDLDGVTLFKALTLALGQLNLTMRIDDDGLVVITSESGSNEDGVPATPDAAEWARLDQIHGRLYGIAAQLASLRREVSLLRETLHLPPPDRPAAPSAAPGSPTPGGGFR